MNRLVLAWNVSARWMRLIFLLILFTVLQVSLTAPNSHAAQPSVSATMYQIIEQWPIGSQGHGHSIVTAVRGPTQAQLKALADQLKLDTKTDKVAMIWIFDDERAAKNRRMIGSGALSKSDEKFYNQHFLGQYQRISSSGTHQLYLYPKGVNAPQVEIKY